MRFLSLITLMLCAALAACVPDDTAATPSPVPTQLPPTASVPHFTLDGTLAFSRDAIDLALPHPVGWETFTTAHGIVLAEKFGTVADHGAQHGLLMYVFMTALDAYPVAIVDTESTNLAHNILSDITAQPDNTLLTSAVEAFRWGDYDAAYYLSTEPGTGLQTIVIALALPEWNTLITCALSAPEQAAPRIRSVLPLLLGELRINTVVLGADELHGLPEPLLFPR